ncbi:hypothetical protein L249_5976 [Ophiocordyceps polyrhachis-furcata BCC 54312]|uniref:non-specific serine/threonine protein kinase n=1 Tax=Ophiocordyceps polyrhachis-furcata BCC 54312 TaxID=1330021 RepID=A0A367LJ90_9HYPO|nr:hypothetical protein L249_5976 [Ophiocordyceps polyrhachis-furcata BCC 54312]
MNGGDLSLSQALGGLRIANPDDSSNQPITTESYPEPLPPPSRFSDSTSIPVSSQATSEAIRMNGVPPISAPSLPSDVDRSPLYEQVGNNSVSASCGSALPLPEQRQSEQQAPFHKPRQKAMCLNSDSPMPQRRSSRGVRSSDQTRTMTSAGAQNNAFAGDSLVPSTTEEWKDRGAAVGIRREMDSSGRPVVRHVKKGVRDFSFGRILGEGSYSTVYLATDRQTLKEYAIKVLEKRHIIKEKKIKYVNIEKNTLNRLTEHQGIVRLYYTFQDETSLYYVLDLCSGGELLGVLKKTGTFDVACTRFYGAQILDSIDYMHSRGVVHRDLKPENVLLDDLMHVKITDFGTARLLRDPREPMNLNGPDGSLSAQDMREIPEHTRAASFVGTAEYVSPELLTQKTASKASDLWAYGCIIYQMLAGRPPFKAASEYLTFQKIVNLDYDFPHGFPSSARDVVERCLVLDPDMRLTTEHIRNHEFFHGQQFGEALWRTKAPRLRPYVPPVPDDATIPDCGSSTEVPVSPASTTPRHISHSSGHPLLGNNRPSRIITELPPPTQLDIEWSPVLTKTNERILKLGDLIVNATPQQNANGSKGSEDGSKKLSRFFGGSNSKKRQRLVMITTSGRIILAPAGGEEKRSKQELSLLSPDCTWRSQRDAKGQMDGHQYTFEEPKTSSASDACRNSADEWIACLDKSKGLGLAYNSTTQGDGHMLDDVPSIMSTPPNTLAFAETNGLIERSPRNHLSKSQTTAIDVGNKRNRFSKRQSRTGLGPVF